MRVCVIRVVMIIRSFVETISPSVPEGIGASRSRRILLRIVHVSDCRCIESILFRGLEE